MSVIDLDQLLEAILPDAPCGESDLEYDPAFIELETKLQGTPPVYVEKRLVQEGKEPNWAEIQADASQLLTRTHDLRVTIYLIRALLHTHGLCGFRDGLTLLTGFVERYWDTLYPQLSRDDDNDPTWRIDILMELCAPETVLPTLFRTILCESRAMGRLSLRDIHMAEGKLEPSSDAPDTAPSLATIEAAFQDADPQALQSAAEAVAASLDRLACLETLLAEKIASDHKPTFEALRHMLKEIERVFAQHRHGDAEPDSDTVNDVQRGGGSSPSAQLGAVHSRKEVIRALEQICTYYKQHEPASPVPLLLKRAMRLVDKSFVEIIQDLAPDSLDQIQRLSGGTTTDDS